MSNPDPPNIGSIIVVSVMTMIIFLIAFAFVTTLVHNVLGTAEGWPSDIISLAIIAAIGAFSWVKVKADSTPRARLIQRGDQNLALHAIKKKLLENSPTPSTVVFLTEEHVSTFFGTIVYRGTFDCQNLAGALVRKKFEASARWDGRKGSWQVSSCKITPWNSIES